MSANAESNPTLLPDLQPDTPGARLLLFAIRRMATDGLGDAHAAHAMFTGFGLGFRRPLVLLRALMLDMSRTAERKLTVAPCCCPRATADETALIGAIVAAGGDPAAAHTGLARLLGVRRTPVVLSTAQALVAAFADGGRPLA